MKKSIILKDLTDLFANLSDDFLGKGDFIMAFDKVVEFLNKVGEKNQAEIEAMKLIIDSYIKEAKERNMGDLDSAKSSVASELLGLCKEKLKEMESGHAKVMEEMRVKLSELKDGDPGKDADNEFIVSKVTENLKRKELTGDQTIDVINSDGTEGLIKKERVEGLVELLKRPQGNSFGGGAVAARDFVIDIDLSSQLDGVTKTFNIQAIWNVVSVSLSSFPHTLRKNVDFTYTPTSITFTDEIDAASSLATGQTCVLTVIQA